MSSYCWNCCAMLNKLLLVFPVNVSKCCVGRGGVTRKYCFFGSSKAVNTAHVPWNRGWDTPSGRWEIGACLLLAWKERAMLRSRGECVCCPWLVEVGNRPLARTDKGSSRYGQEVARYLLALHTPGNATLPCS